LQRQVRVCDSDELVRGPEQLQGHGLRDGDERRMRRREEEERSGEEELRRWLSGQSPTYRSKARRFDAALFLCSGRGGDELLQMEVRVAERQVDCRQALEVVADDQLVCHTHAAVQLDRLLSHETSRLPNGNLRC
jgi:hypothetical protein